MRKGIAFEVRPIPARLLKSLGDSLRMTLPGKTVLDLYAGRGTMGMKLLEEGALHAVFVEINRTLTQEIRQTLDRQKLSGTVETADVFKYLKGLSPPQRYDIVLADPPFPLWNDQFEKELFSIAATAMVPEGKMILKIPAHRLPPEAIYDLRLEKISKVGDSQLVYYRR